MGRRAAACDRGAFASFGASARAFAAAGAAGDVARSATAATTAAASATIAAARFAVGRSRLLAPLRHLAFDGQLALHQSFDLTQQIAFVRAYEARGQAGRAARPVRPMRWT